MEKLNLKIKNYIEDEENKNDKGLSFDKNSKVIEINGKEIGFYRTFIISNYLTVEYNLFSKYRNKGFGKEFVELVVGLVEEEYPEYNTLYVRIYKENIASLRVAEANNFTTINYDSDESFLSEGDCYVLSKRNSKYKNNN